MPGSVSRRCSRWPRSSAGCGSGQGGDYGGEHPDYEKALAGSPPPLAALHRQGNELLGGGQDAYEKRIAALRGYPVVVNVWASWCGPCRFEFPTLQRLSAKYGKQVAFLGVDSEDSDDAARTFLAEAPVPYPSYTDPDEDIKDEPRRQLRPPRHRLLRPQRRARLPRSRARTPTRATCGPTSSAARSPKTAKADNRGMDAFVLIAVIAVVLLLAELLLPTGGLLAGLGAIGLIVAGIVALTADADTAATEYVGPALITARRPLRRHLLLRHPQGARGPPRDAGAHRLGGDDRLGRRGPQHARPRGPGLVRGNAVVGAAGRRRRPRRGQGIES